METDGEDDIVNVWIGPKDLRDHFTSTNIFNDDQKGRNSSPEYWSVRLEQLFNQSLKGR